MQGLSRIRNWYIGYKRSMYVDTWGSHRHARTYANTLLETFEIIGVARSSGFVDDVPVVIGVAYWAGDGVSHTVYAG